MFPGERLTDIRIGLTDTDPRNLTPLLGNMNVCFCQNSPFLQGETTSIYCGATGRYVVILLEGIHTLTLCEVQVFEGKHIDIV